MRAKTVTGLALVVSALVAGSAGWAAQAGSQPYQSSGISLSTTSPAPGRPALLSARGFRPGGMVTLSISKSSCGRGPCPGKGATFVTLGHDDANANGIASFKVTIPRSFAPGSTHVLEASGRQDGGKPLTEWAKVTLSGRPKGTGERGRSASGLGA